MTDVPATRLASLTGVASVLLLVVALILEGTPPSADAATADVVQYYAENGTRLLAGTVVAGLSAALLVWFGGSTYATLRRAEGGIGRASATAFGGFVLAAVGHTMLFGFVLAAAETVGDVPAEVTQALGVLAALFVVPLAVGMLVAMLASAVAMLRHAALPRWLGYLTLLIAAAAVVSTGLGAYVAVAVWVVATSVWVALMSVVIFIRS